MCGVFTKQTKYLSAPNHQPRKYWYFGRLVYLFVFSIYTWIGLILNHFMLNSFQETWNYIYISIISQHRDKDGTCNQWLGDARSQSISRWCMELVLPEYFSFRTRTINEQVASLKMAMKISLTEEIIAAIDKRHYQIFYREWQYFSWNWCKISNTLQIAPFWINHFHYYWVFISKSNPQQIFSRTYSSKNSHIFLGKAITEHRCLPEGQDCGNWKQLSPFVLWPVFPTYNNTPKLTLVIKVWGICCELERCYLCSIITIVVFC